MAITGKSAIPTFVTLVLGLVNVAAVNTALGCAVYDRVPRNATFPYIALQSPQELRDGQMGQPSKSVSIDLHIFTSDETDLGSEKATQIASKVCELTEYPTVNAGTDWSSVTIWSDGVLDVGDEVDDGRHLKHYVVTVRGYFVPA